MCEFEFVWLLLFCSVLSCFLAFLFSCFLVLILFLFFLHPELFHLKPSVTKATHQTGKNRQEEETQKVTPDRLRALDSRTKNTLEHDFCFERPRMMIFPRFKLAHARPGRFGLARTRINYLPTARASKHVTVQREL